jgi:hypothetical protein
MSTVAQLYLNDKDFDLRWDSISQDFEGYLKQGTQRMIKRLIETSMELEVQDLIVSLGSGVTYMTYSTTMSITRET